MKAEIISIGTELVSGQSLDTNSQWLSRALAAVGVAVRFHSTLSDDLAENVDAFRHAIGRADLVVVSGGLGPTQDDLTREVLAEVAGVPLIEDSASLHAITTMFTQRHLTMPARNRVQALLPRGAEALPNRVGTAPGVWMKVGEAHLACLPGVPHEMKIMHEEQVVPRLRRLGGAERVMIERKINLFGKGESAIEAEALDLTVRGRNPEVGITAHDATISFRIVSSGTTLEAAEHLMAPTLAAIRERFAQLILGEGSADMPEALFAQLRRTALTLATAESCTGGLIAQQITTVPGVGDYFLGGVVSYANDAKHQLLGIEPNLIKKFGAVSEPIAEAMALGIRERLSADIGLSVTGIAGPSGGTEEKPVGLVLIGLATASGVATRRLEIGPEQPRRVIQSRAAKHAMNWVRLTLLALPDSVK